MKLIKTLSFSLLMASISLNASALNLNKNVKMYTEPPAKTVFIKNPAAADVNAFFSGITVLNIEIYKSGSELAKIVSTLKSNSNVESCIEGKVTGDYQAVTLTLKNKKDKAWFAAEFKKAGLGHIKINNNPIVEVEKM
jgi:hypothetical protein